MNLRKNLFVHCPNPNWCLDFSNISYRIENKNTHQISDFIFGTNTFSIGQPTCFICHVVDHSFTDSLSAWYFLLEEFSPSFSIYICTTFLLIQFILFYSFYLSMYYIIYLAWLREHVLSFLFLTTHTRVFQFLPSFFNRFNICYGHTSLLF